MVKKIFRCKQENPTVFSWEIRNHLRSQTNWEAGFPMPSISPLNKSHRNGFKLNNS